MKRRVASPRTKGLRPLVSCPTCHRPVEWSAASPFRPFCSERCRLIDLGAWVSEQRSIAGDEQLPGDAEATDPSEIDPDVPAHDPQQH